VCTAIIQAWSKTSVPTIPESTVPCEQDEGVFNLESLSNGLESANHMMTALHDYKQTMFKNGSAIDMKQYHKYERENLIRQHNDKVQTLETAIKRLRQEISGHEQTVKRYIEENRRMTLTVQTIKSENQHIRTCFDSYMLTIPLEVQTVISDILMARQLKK
jgi:hypothetical protein